MREKITSAINLDVVGSLMLMSARVWITAGKPITQEYLQRLLARRKDKICR
jgi:hypothetical protein